LVKYDGKSIKKFDENLPDFSIINQNNENKNNFLESSFLDDELIKLTKELKDITKKVAEPEDKASKSEKKNKMEADSAEEKKDENLKQPNPENDFIPLKDYPKFKNEAQIAEIEKVLEQIKEYKVRENIANKLKFKEIEHDDVINFKDESILEFFKSLNFILSENSKMRLIIFKNKIRAP